MDGADWPRGRAIYDNHRISGLGARSWHLASRAPAQYIDPQCQCFVSWMLPLLPFPAHPHLLSLRAPSSPCPALTPRNSNCSTNFTLSSVMRSPTTSTLDLRTVRSITILTPCPPFPAYLPVPLQGCFSPCTSSQSGYSCESRFPSPPHPFRVSSASTLAPKDPCSIPEETCSCLEAQRLSLCWLPL